MTGKIVWTGLLLSLSILAVSAAARPLQVASQSVLENHQPPSTATLRLVRVDSGPASEKTFELRPGHSEVDLDPGFWRISATAVGYWSPEQTLEIEQNHPSKITLPWRPIGNLEARLLCGDNDDPPSEVSIRFASTPGEQDEISEALITCPVTDSKISCPVPAAVPLDLRVRARGHVSHFFWAQNVPPQGRQNLGDLKLIPGASVVGWIEAPTRNFRFADCKIELFPKTAGDSPGARDFKQRSRMASTVKANERGFFEITDLRPGQYTLKIDHPTYATVRRSPIQVFPRAETEIRDLELLFPSQLTVNVFPPIAPTRQPWRVNLIKEGEIPGFFDSEASGSTQSGLWLAENLDPGHYHVGIEDSQGARWDRQSLELFPGQTDARLDFLLEAHFVKGTLSLGGEPIEGTLFFGGFFGSTRAITRSDEEGRFNVTLPANKVWKLAVDVPTLGLRRELPDVELEAKNGAAIELEIELPDTRVQGIVVDEEDQPMSAVDLRAFRDEDTLDASATSQENGEFVLQALDPGPWRIQAKLHAENMSSDIVSIEVQEKLERDVRLVLRHELDFHGKLVSAAGRPIVGARMVALVEQESLNLTNSIPEAITTVTGAFKLSVPAKAQGLQLTVLAPGFAIRQFRFSREEMKETQLLTVDQIGGTVVLAESEGNSLNRLRFNLFRQRLIATSYALRDWAKAHGYRRSDNEPLTIPMLEPGRYTACIASRNQTTFSTGQIPTAEPELCASGELAPYGELILTLPSTKSKVDF